MLKLQDIEIISRKIDRSEILIAKFINGYASGWEFAVRKEFKSSLDIKKTKKVINKKTFEEYKNNLSKIWSNIGIVKTKEGYTITYIKKGGVFDKIGLKKGDILLEVGLDSAVVAVLAHNVFGKDLLCVKMPSHYSSQSSLDDADELCKEFGLNSSTASIEPMLRAYEELNPNLDNLRKGNFSSRMRMATLFDISARENALVLGTRNKSELMLGYGTLYGDLASAVNPIGDLYKSEVFELARYLGVTKSIIQKPPSADLWDGQSDEDDLGYTYAELDEAMKLYVDKRLSRDEIVAHGIGAKMLDMIIQRIFRNHFKRKMPVIAKLTSRTLNHDFNYPRDITL